MDILEATQQSGEWFRYVGGIAKIILTGAQSGATYTLYARDGDDGTAVDADVEWTGDGVQVAYIAADLRYRLSGDSASAIGAVARIVHVG